MNGRRVLMVATLLATVAALPSRPHAALAGESTLGTSTVVPSTTALLGPLNPPKVTLREVAELDSPVDLAWRAGDPTLFIVSQQGTIVPLRDGKAGEPVLDVRALTAPGGERGLLGLAFSPDGAWGYVDYTDTAGNTIVAAYPVGADGTFDAAKAAVLLRVEQPYPNHNGGALVVDAVGRLYIGMGDGGAGGDPERRALKMDTELGKILRIDPQATIAAGKPVPATGNPFPDAAGVLPTIWASGVRNPWRMNLDAATGDLWIADVGQGAWEEIDHVPAAQVERGGLNFGWSAFEGSRPFNTDVASEGVTMPVYEYPHGDDGCSISGGAVYRGDALPSLAGRYLYSDFCAGRLIVLDFSSVPVTAHRLADSEQVSAVRAGPDGEIYVLSLKGSVSLLVPAG